MRWVLRENGPSRPAIWGDSKEDAGPGSIPGRSIAGIRYVVTRIWESKALREPFHG